MGGALRDKRGSGGDSQGPMALERVRAGPAVLPAGGKKTDAETRSVQTLRHCPARSQTHHTASESSAPPHSALAAGKQRRFEAPQRLLAHGARQRQSSQSPRPTQNALLPGTETSPIRSPLRAACVPSIAGVQALFKRRFRLRPPPGRACPKHSQNCEKGAGGTQNCLHAREGNFKRRLKLSRSAPRSTYCCRRGRFG